MADFLEERISADILTGAGYQDDYSVNVVTDSGGNEYRSLYHPFPVRKFDISYLLEKHGMWAQLLNLYHRAHGKYAGFRIRAIDDYKSCSLNATTSALDQTCSVVTVGSVYQLRKYYGTDGAAGASGYPVRIIHKPVSGTAKVAIDGLELSSTGNWSVDSTNGHVNFLQNNRVIFGISKATHAVIDFEINHQFSIGMSIGFSSVSGMTQINGMRGMVINATVYTVTVDIDTSGFSTYTSGGVASKSPMSGEVITAGFEFDIPVRFNTTIPVGQDFTNYRSLDGIELIELLNP